MKRLAAWWRQLFTPKPKLVLPHPEEPCDPNKTAANTDIDAVFAQWYTGWNVPLQWRDYWRTAIVIELRDHWDGYLGLAEGTPAATWDGGDGKRHLASLAPWFNAGVLAHEICHCSYALLSGPARLEFTKRFFELLYVDPLMKLLFSTNTYGLTSIVEGHAECGRYLSQQMPDALKPFYPRLLQEVG